MLLQGVIPPDWGQPGAFPSLQHLNVGGNQLKGRLPEMGFGALSKLEVSTCTLSGGRHCSCLQQGMWPTGH